jgi:hypothetical protein
MTRNSDSSNEELFRRGCRTLSVLALCMTASTEMAQASPIRHHQISSVSTAELPAWHEFLESGPEHWSRVQSPKIGTEIHHIMNHALKSADPTSSLNVEYLMWRQSLDPARFDHYHPRVGRELKSMLTPTSVSPTSNPGGAVEPEQLIPPTTTSTPATPSSSTSASTLPSSSATGPEEVSPTTGTSGTSPAPAAIPEPGTMTIALVLIGSGLWWRARRPRIC